MYSGIFIFFVKKFFCRFLSEKKIKIRMEYVFIKFKSLFGCIFVVIKGYRFGLMIVIFFVFVVLYIFLNEVLLRVVKMVFKWLKKLVNKVESISNGRDGDVFKDDDIKLLSGWRWRVLEFIDWIWGCGLCGYEECEMRNDEMMMMSNDMILFFWFCLCLFRK